MIDIVPTLQYYLQIPLGNHLEGRVQQDWFTPEFLRDNPVPDRKEVSDRTSFPTQSAYSDQDEKKIEQRLKDLGYM
jgi:hypothetical protein